ILIMSFFYVVTAYYLVMVYKVETHSAAYNPLYSQNTIGKRSEYNLPCVLKVGEESFSGLLTNWDERGCFVSFDPGEAGLIELRGELHFEVRLDGVLFAQTGKVVGSYERGVGIRFTPEANDLSEGYNWS